MSSATLMLKNWDALKKIVFTNLEYSSLNQDHNRAFSRAVQSTNKDIAEASKKIVDKSKSSTATETLKSGKKTGVKNL